MFGVDDLVTGGAPILGGILGNVFSSGDRQQALNDYKKAVEQIQAIGIPPELAAPIVLQQYQQAGKLTPDLEQAINQNSSAMAGIQENPDVRNASMQALQTLLNTGNTGLTAQDRADYNKLRTQSNADSTARLNSIVQNMKSRGLGGSGAELAAKLSEAQSGANRQSQAADDVAAQASQRALQAMSSAGNLGQQIRGQDFGVNQARAAAQDEMNRFNIQNQLAQQQRNVAMQNQAQQYNLNNAQNIGNANVQQNNNELYRQRQAQQQDYANKVGYGQMQANALNRLGDVYNGQSQQTAQMLTGLGQGVGQMAGNYFQNQRNQNNFNNLMQYLGNQ